MSKKISELTAASELTGTELVEVVQSGTNKRTTAQDIADIASGFSEYQGTLTTSQILNANSSPVTLVAAPGAGKIIEIIPLVWYKLNYTTAAFATNTNSSLAWGASGIAASQATAILAQTASNYSYAANSGSSATLTAAQVENLPIVFQVTGGNPTAGGTNTLVINFKYRILTL